MTRTAASPTAQFPIDLEAFQPLPLDPTVETLTDEQKRTLGANIQLCRDVIVFFTAVAGARGLGGHTGGPYDTVPEVMLAYSFMQHGEGVVPVFFDEAGHRVATQYLMAVLEGDLPAERLLHYRAYLSHLPGHPERGFTPGVKFSSGRLGHIWPFVNGVAMAHPRRSLFVLGSDGSQMEGNDAEAARLAVAHQLEVKLLIDDNDVTIAGHPSNYMPGFDIAKTLEGHGLTVSVGDGENLEQLHRRMIEALNTPGPVALVNKRPMAVGIEGLEGEYHAHDVIKTEPAIRYLEQRGHTAAIDYLRAVEKDPSRPVYPGSADKTDKNRSLFGKVMNELLDEIPEQTRVQTVRVFDNDLEGSTGVQSIREKHPEVFISGGVMERGNFSAAAGFGMDPGRQGVYATFSAFLEMAVSEITMARLNHANVLCHYSHAGVDDMADNTCHFGLNNFFADNGLPDEGRDLTRLYFPADPGQFRACLKAIFHDPGLRFIFSNRSSVPFLLKEDGSPLFDDDYTFTPGRDEIVREAAEGRGYVVSFGATTHRALGAVEQLRQDGAGVGLINKPSLNVIDEQMMDRLRRAPFVLVAEEFNVRTGLGVRFGTELLKRGFTGRYDHIGTNREGSGGLWRQMDYQGLAPDGIVEAVRELM